MSIELLNIDCMEYMAGLPDKAFDLAIVDPPYQLDGWHDKGNNKNRFSASEGSKRKDWDILPTQKYFDELKRISKNRIIWGGNYFLDFLGKCVAPIIWDKMNPGVHFADGELAWTSFSKGTLRIFKKHIFQTELNSQRIHPTQKPIKLYSWLLHNYAKEGDRILDTHLGSGSSAIAAHKRGFYFVGCEIDKDYYNAAVKRFKEQTMQQALF